MEATCALQERTEQSVTLALQCKRRCHGSLVVSGAPPDLSVLYAVRLYVCHIDDITGEGHSKALNEVVEGSQ